jgi:hypothetical protein
MVRQALGGKSAAGQGSATIQSGGQKQREGRDWILSDYLAFIRSSSVGIGSWAHGTTPAIAFDPKPPEAKRWQSFPVSHIGALLPGFREARNRYIRSAGAAAGSGIQPPPAPQPATLFDLTACLLFFDTSW